jgi:hypothetical protein
VPSTEFLARPSHGPPAALYSARAELDRHPPSRTRGSAARHAARAPEPRRAAFPQGHPDDDDPLGDETSFFLEMARQHRQPPEERRKESEPPDPLPVGPVANLITRLERAQIVDGEAGIMDRLGTDVADVALGSLKKINDAQVMHFQRTKMKVVGRGEDVIGGGFPKHQMMGQTIARAGPGGVLLVVGDGQTLKTFRLSSGEFITRRCVAGNIAGVVVPPFDPSLCAVWTAQRVYVFAINEDGSIELNHEVQLMLESLWPKLFVMSVEWVPYEPCYLAVTTGSFVKIYDVPSDCISPIACFTSHKDKITNTMLFDVADEPYIAVAVASGKIAVYKCEVDMSNGAVEIARFVRFNFANDGAILSYSAVSRLAFSRRALHFSSSALNNYSLTLLMSSFP